MISSTRPTGRLRPRIRSSRRSLTSARWSCSQRCAAGLGQPGSMFYVVVHFVWGMVYVAQVGWRFIRRWHVERPDLPHCCSKAARSSGNVRPGSGPTSRAVWRAVSHKRVPLCACCCLHCELMLCSSFPCIPAAALHTLQLGCTAIHEFPHLLPRPPLSTATTFNPAPPLYSYHLTPPSATPAPSHLRTSSSSWPATACGM